MDWNSRISPQVKNMAPSGIRKFFDVPRDVITLGIGEPDFTTPLNIRESCIESLQKGNTAYTANQGLLELRQAIVTSIFDNYDVKYDAKTEVLVTVGVSEAVDLAMRILLSPNDEVLIPEPCYVSYDACVLLAGGVPVHVPTYLENSFSVSVETLEKYVTDKTKVLLLSYPNNPTGAIMTHDELSKIAQFAVKHDLIIISDEIYAQLTYEGQHTCFSSLPGMKDRTILLNGVSKAYAMTGWRIGYALANPVFIAAMTKIHQYTMLCAPTTGQIAAIEALKNSTSAVHEMVAEYNTRRQLMLHGLRSMGLDCFEPKGAFYIFPSIKKTSLSSLEFAEKLLQQEKVAVIPGTAFGESGEGFIRCAYATSTDKLEEALIRIERFIKSL